MKTAGIAVCAGAMALTAPAGAQDVLVRSFSETRVVEDACSRASLDCFLVFSHRAFAEELATGEWKLAVFEWYVDLAPEDKDLLLPALADHLNRGGRLLLVYSELDEWPELQELVSVRTAGGIPSSRGRRIWSVQPPHPIWDREWLLGGDDYWADNGDFLDPQESAYTLATWDMPGGHPAMVLSRGGRVLTNGFSLDSFELDGVWRIVMNQLTWLLDCQADLDGDGALTFFDFLEFQNLFAAGDPAADFAFDGRLDFFDFLEFQNQFAIGCP